MKRDAHGHIVYSRDPKDPPFWPAEMTLDDMLDRLKLLDPKDHAGMLDAFKVFVEDHLRSRWGREPKASH